MSSAHLVSSYCLTDAFGNNDIIGHGSSPQIVYVNESKSPIGIPVAIGTGYGTTTLAVRISRLLNEPQNPDVAGGGWPVAPEVAAQRLKPVIAAIRKAGGKVACCNLLMYPGDTSAADWWARWIKAGGTQDIISYHIFARSTAGAAQVKQRAEALFPGPLIISESGFCRPVADYVRRIESPRYAAVFTLRSADRCP